MANWMWGTRSLSRLAGIDPKLREYADLVLSRSKFDLTIPTGGGLRTVEQARENAKNKTGVLNSRHLTGDAVDMSPLVDGEIPWDLSIPKHREIWDDHMDNMEWCAAKLGMAAVFGWDWDCDGVRQEAGEYDLSHTQLPWPNQVAKARSLLVVRRKLLMIEDSVCPSCGRSTCPTCGS